MNMTQGDKLIYDKINSSQDSTNQNKKIIRSDAKEVIKEFGVAPGGKPYFLEFKDDLSKMQADNEGNPIQTSALNQIEVAIDHIIEKFSYLKQLLSDYDNKLMNVIVRHEDDFLAAYKTHMNKVEK